MDSEQEIHYRIKDVDVRILVLDHKESFDKSRLKEAILSFQQEDVLCQKFPHIVYQFSQAKDVDAKHNDIMWMLPSDVYNGKYVVYINSLHKEIFSGIKALKKDLLHEVSHIWYYRSFRAAKNILDAVKRIRKMPAKDYGLTRRFPDVRSSLTEDFSTNLLVEGIAEYVSNVVYSDSFVDEKTFDRLYRKAYRKAKGIRYYYEGLWNDEKGFFRTILGMKARDKYSRATWFMGYLKDASYIIGHHMVQAVLYIDKTMTIEEVCGMNHLAFIKKYEACMNLIGKQPVVSLTSGKGTIDIKQMVDGLNENYKGARN